VSDSTHCHERNLPVVLITANAGAPRIEDRLVIHKKQILVVAMREQHFDEPPTILTAAHRMRSGIPPVEIADQINRLRRWRGTIEIDRLGCFSCGIQIRDALVRRGVHSKWLCGFSGSTFVMMRFEKSAEDQPGAPGTPS
jgi:hypothetical protein